MSYQRTMSIGDYVIDRDAEQFDHEESRQDRMQAYLIKRGAEIEERRMCNVSTQDFVLALEIISTIPVQVERMRQMVYGNDDGLAAEMRGMIHAALIKDSFDIAMAEFKAMEAEPPSQERH